MTDLSPGKVVARINLEKHESKDLAAARRAVQGHIEGTGNAANLEWVQIGGTLDVRTKPGSKVSKTSMVFFCKGLREKLGEIGIERKCLLETVATPEPSALERVRASKQAVAR